MDEFPLTKMYGKNEGNEFRRIRIQPLCGEHLFWVSYLFLGKNEKIH
jgi:hypothetical protein